jgi:hypothetical protein
MPATQRLTFRQIVVVGGLNQWANAKLALLQSPPPFVVPMEKLLLQFPSLALSNALAVNRAASMLLRLSLPLNA